MANYNKNNAALAHNHKCAVHGCKAYALYITLSPTQATWKLSRRRKLYLCARCVSEMDIAKAVLLSTLTATV